MQPRQSGFDRLVSELSRDERVRMLERIRTSAAIVEEPLSQFQEEPKVDLLAELRRLTVIQRVLLLLRSVFTGKNRVEALEQLLIKDLGRRIQRSAPGFIDLRTNSCKALLYERLEMLKGYAQVFRRPLARVLGGPELSFYAFLCGFELPDLHNQLEEDTDPFRLVAAEPDLAEPEVRRRVFVNMEYILEGMPADGRRRMYNNAQALESLYELSRYPFEELLDSFQTSPEGTVVDCPFEYIREPLTKLCGLMLSMEFFPSSRLVEALHLYLNRDRLDWGAGTAQMEHELARQVRIASDALNGIRSFTAEVPLPQIVRLMHGDINFTPALSSGGEQWFARVKRFWHKRIERHYDAYLFTAKHKQRRDQARHLLGVAVEPLSEYCAFSRRTTLRENGWMTGRFALSLGVIRAFSAGPFRTQMHAPLKNLHIDGEFYKKENRNEYTRAFNALISIDSQIDAFRIRLSETGEFGLHLKRLAPESNASGAYHSELVELVNRVDSAAHQMVREYVGALDSIAEVLNGILYGEVGAKYDTLANLGQIGGRSHKRLMVQLDTSMKWARDLADLMRQIIQLEETSTQLVGDAELDAS